MANLFARVGVKNGPVAGDNDRIREGIGRHSASPAWRARCLRRRSTAEHSRWIPAKTGAMSSPTGSPARKYNFSRAPWSIACGRTSWGAALVDPVDDVRATNPASNEEFLQALTKDFVENGFDLRRLIRTIMNSGTYQLSSQSPKGGVPDEKYYSHYIIRRLPAEVILDAISQVTGVPQNFEGYPPGTRALQLPDTRVDSYFLTVFGRPDRIIPCDCERQQDPSLTQALHLINGETVNRKIIDLNSLTESYLKLGMSGGNDSGPSLPDRAEPPASAAEKQEILKAFQEAEALPISASQNSKREFIEDLIWAVVSGREFLFNH